MASAGPGIGEVREVPREPHLRRHLLSGLTLNLYDLEREHFLKFCSQVPHSSPECGAVQVRKEDKAMSQGTVSIGQTEWRRPQVVDKVCEGHERPALQVM